MAFKRWVATENFFKSLVFCLVTASSEPAVERYWAGFDENNSSKDLLRGPDLYCSAAIAPIALFNSETDAPC